MKAKEIRELEFEHGYSKPNDINTFIVLREIAAQLAELNDKLPSALSNDERFRVEVRHWAE